MPITKLMLEGRLLRDPHEPPFHGWIEILDDRITAHGKGRPPRPADLGGEDRLITPGFIDAHVHLPQIGSIGCVSTDLLSWLDQVIFPAEALWQNHSHAEQRLKNALARLLASGTIGAAAYLTAHAHGPALLASVHRNLPLRLHAGQAVMDRGGPASIVNEPLAPLPPDEDRRTASINPRFAPACSAELLKRLGALATSRSAFIQTHLAEQPEECALVARCFPDAPHYTGVYDAAGLLGAKTLLAHCLHLSPAEWALIRDRDAIIVHCPTANTFLASGLFDLATARRHGIRIALGSDLAAGSDAAMPRVARAMIEVATLRRRTIDPEAFIPSPEEAFTMITRGNAELLGFEDHGRLEIGDRADLLILRPRCPIDRHLIGRLIFGWDDAMIEHRFLDGRLVHLDVASGLDG